VCIYIYIYIYIYIISSLRVKNLKTRSLKLQKTKSYPHNTSQMSNNYNRRNLFIMYIYYTRKPVDNGTARG